MNWFSAKRGSFEDKLSTLTLELQLKWINKALDIFLWVLILTALAVVCYALFWHVFIRIQPKQISGINLTDEAIDLSIAGDIITIPAFHTYKHEIENVGEIKIDQLDSQGEVISSKSHFVTNISGAAVDIYLPSGVDPMCPTLIDVTGLFYQNSHQAPVELAELLSASPTNSIFYQYGLWSEFEYLLKPGSYSGKHLPKSIGSTQSVFGIYFVPCERVTETEDLLDEVLWWTNYSPQSQQQLVEQSREAISKTPEYN